LFLQIGCESVNVLFLSKHGGKLNVKHGEAYVTNSFYALSTRLMCVSSTIQLKLSKISLALEHCTCVLFYTIALYYLHFAVG